MRDPYKEVKAMIYKKFIHPQLRNNAHRVPYNKAVIYIANIFQSIAFHMKKVPKGIKQSKFTIQVNHLSLKTHVFEPKDSSKKLPCLLYIHGGAFSYKASMIHKHYACLYALEANCKVFFPDYHLLPKYPYPTAYEEVLALYQYLMHHGDELNIDINRIGIGGDSAGACLSALLCNHIEKENLITPCAQMLIYPAVDADMQSESMKKYTDTPIWNAKNNQRMWKMYLRNSNEEMKRNASPMQNVLPSKIPNTYMEATEFDCLHDEGIFYGLRLQAAGAKVIINDTKGTYHAYDAAIHKKIVHTHVKQRISFLNDCFYKR